MTHVQAVQPLAAKVCIDTYPNLKQVALSKDGASMEWEAPSRGKLEPQ